MIIMFTDKSRGTLHVRASAITSMQRIPADSWPERTRITTTATHGDYTFQDSREDFERNLAAWREAVTPKPVADPSAGISRNPC